MKIGVIGSGSIGPDLAYGFVSAICRIPGAKVYLVDIRQEALDAGVARIRGYVRKGLARGKLSEKVAQAIDDALTPTLSLADLAECQYVLEAASEDLSVKKAILKNLEEVVGPDALIGFATSGIPRAQIAADAKHPDRCFVNHPFFPAWRSLPIEVVHSGDAALGARMIDLLERLGKVPIVTEDVACFAADDIFCNYISEAARIVQEGLATPEQVDRVVNDAIGGGGPFKVMDATRGNLLTVKCQRLMQHAPTGTPWFEPPAILEKQGNDLWLDRKNPKSTKLDKQTATRVLDRILAVLLARTYFVVDEKICARTDLNWLTRMALGFDRGVIELALDLGPDRVKALCTAYAADHEGFEVPASIASGNLGALRVNVKVERDADIGVVRIFRPEVKNALSKSTIEEISRAMDDLIADPAIRGIVLTSSDGALAGADITELAALESPEACRDICKKTHPVMLRISASEKPVVAALDGPVMGGGAELSMACHARVVGKNLILSQPEVNLGIIPGYGGTQRLPRLIGIERAADMIRTAKVVRATDAVSWGWADEVSDDPRRGRGPTDPATPRQRDRARRRSAPSRSMCPSACPRSTSRTAPWRSMRSRSM